MIVLRLTRVGKKKQPSYRLVVQEKHKDPWGKAFEILGQYNPRTNPKTINFKADRIKEWLAKGAQPSATVHNLLVDAKIITAEKVNATMGDKKHPGKPAEADAKKAETKA